MEWLAADGDQFGGDGDCDFLGSDGADVEADGGVNAVEKMRGHAFFLQSLENLDHFALGADHADIAGARLHGPAEDAHVVAVAAGDDDDVGGLVGIELLRGLVEIERVHFACGGEAFLVA